MPQLPHKLPEKGIGKAHARALNQLMDYVRTLRPVATINEEVEHTAHGTVRRPKANSSGGSGTVPRWL